VPANPIDDLPGANCTHLHDLAVLAAAHAFDTAPTVYDILVSDPVAGRSEGELRRNGIAVLDWSVVKTRIIAPAPLAGLDLDNMRTWIESLDPDTQEAATRVGAIRDFSRDTARPLDSASPTPQDTDLFHVTRDHTSRSFAGRRTP
jgi:hypothetical protein